MNWVRSLKKNGKQMAAAQCTSVCPSQIGAASTFKGRLKVVRRYCALLVIKSSDPLLGFVRLCTR